MADKPYSKREIDVLAKSLGDQIGNVQNALELKMSDDHKTVADSLSRIEIQVAFTNGKVRKITVALVLMGGIMLGAGFQYAPTVLSLLF
jgi:hypothetical protein